MFPLEIRPGAQLRLLEEADAATVFQCVDRHRDTLREWLPWVDLTTTPDDTLHFIREELGKTREKRGCTAGLWCEGEFAGVFGVHEPAWLSRKTSVGYWLAPPFERRGLITDATRVVVTRLFREWEMHRVEIHVARDNNRSAAVALRLGFKEEALLREAVFANGRYHDMRVFAMLAREWPHDPSARPSPLDAR